jgi:hypothetical protein
VSNEGFESLYVELQSTSSSITLLLTFSAFIFVRVSGLVANQLPASRIANKVLDLAYVPIWGETVQSKMPIALNANSSTPTIHVCSPLYRLPLEIRERIWIYLMLLQNAESAITAYGPTIELPYPRFGRPRLIKNPAIQNKISIVRTCHAIRLEVLPICYKHGQFTFSSCTRMVTFLLNVPLEYRSLLRDITVTWTYRNSYQASRMLLNCTGLQNLTILIGSGAQLPLLRRYQHKMNLRRSLYLTSEG